VPDVVERFAREARAAAKIQGEHVARVLDVGRFDDGMPFMVMECLQGHDLADELAQRGHLPPADAVRHVLETCEALAQAHALRIVHRDLKPSNLFLAEQPGRPPVVKVLDFGISKVVDANSDALTKTASVMGTPFYMSPEQLLSSKNVDERSDIWSLGIILYELLVGQPPFGGDTAPEIIAKIMLNEPQPPRALRPDIPPGLEAVILRCMRTKPHERFANVAQLAAALAPFGAPSDRESAVAISRVLGAAVPEFEQAGEHAPEATCRSRRTVCPACGGLRAACGAGWCRSGW
jgi:serine/threonine protein kinase